MISLHHLGAAPTLPHVPLALYLVGFFSPTYDPAQSPFVNYHRALEYERLKSSQYLDLLASAELQERHDPALAKIFRKRRIDPNTLVAGNGGGLDANGPPMHGLASSATLTIPANGLLVFSKTKAA
jgi:hypothetical protein